ncbi:hypothetical protein [Blastococcus sp. SYSU DS0541]
MDKIDPERLLAIGAPPGDCESERRTSFLAHVDVSEQSVFAVCERAFGPESYLSRRLGMLTLLTHQLHKARDQRTQPS